MDNSPSDNPVSEKYRALQIDAFPIIEKRQLHDYKNSLMTTLKSMVNLLNPLTAGVNTFPLMEPYALSAMPL